MLALGPLAFTAPWMLAGLAALPAIWWLLRISPPLPKRVRFPAIRLLVGLVREEETPAHTPLWLLLLRMAIAALVVLALAGPVWNPSARVGGAGPLLIVTDNGWSSAARWSERRATMDALIADAARENRAVLAVGTAPEINPSPLAFEAAAEAHARARAMEPQPIEPDQVALIERLEGAAMPDGVQAVWLSDGLDHGAAAQFSERLAALTGGGVTLIEPAPAARALALLPPERDAGGIAPRIIRADGTGIREGSVRALDAEGSTIGDIGFTLGEGETATEARFDMPLELRNRIARLEIAGEASAGAVVLADERWRRRNAGIVSGARLEEAQPLLSDVYYLRRALAPYVELREAAQERNADAAIEALLSSPLSVLVLADIGNLTSASHDRIAAFIENGGMLIRFAGPRLAEHGDDLVPVPLRSGGRALGGALSWSTPQSLAPFEEDSPFFGIDVPEDVSVARQVLAEPSPELARHTWARLSDGTPLVTAAQRGKGTIVLFHVTANRDWSTLPISGLFVEMLKRSVELSQGVVSTETPGGARERALLSPLATLNGFGRLGTPPATATPIAYERLYSAERSPRHPPGLYGPASSPRALNLATAEMELQPLGALPGLSERRLFEGAPELRLAALFLVIALFLLVLDTLAALWVTGLFETEKIRRVRFAMRAAPVLLAVALIAPLSDARAQETLPPDEFALKATLETRLAYVITGDREIDATSEAGLSGLSMALRARTAFEPAEPMGVNVERDELSFFPLLYWPMSEGQDSLTPQALAKINAYMKNGGTILFDTRDQDRAAGGAVTPGTATMRRLIGQLDLPPLEPVTPDHVLTRSYYLLQQFPGRYDGGQVWVEAVTAETDQIANDGVTTIVVGANDYAAAWARDRNGRALYATTPGGERQREMAYRFGINLVIYALTGNYKADQVHVPALLERLGQ
ncbi:MAG: DUF4159 domain-containing protein [Parvibaculaceae bacterium]|nr:DUF4159 domain-containing protein [Parvibaculaceae bacterium]